MVHNYAAHTEGACNYAAHTEGACNYAAHTEDACAAITVPLNISHFFNHSPTNNEDDAEDRECRPYTYTHRSGDGVRHSQLPLQTLVTNMGMLYMSVLLCSLEQAV
eukprot:scpid108539/ scgid29697/ 